MGKLRWPDGTAIEGVTVGPAKDNLDATITLDFDLSPPASSNEAAEPELLAALHEQYGFLPNEPGLIRQSDLNEIDACLAFAEDLIKPFGYHRQFEQDLILALGCVCFRDKILCNVAVCLDYEDADGVQRFMAALNAVITEAFP